MSLGVTLKKSMSATKAMLGVGAVIVMTAASVSPADLKSNISSWADYLGLQRLSGWLDFPGADQVAFWFGAILLASFLGWTAVSAWRNTHPVKTNAPPLVSEPAPTTLATGSDPFTALFFECAMTGMPTTSPPGGSINVLSLWPLPIENGGGGLGQYFSMAEPRTLAWPKSQGGLPLMAYRCTITNYSAVPVSNVTLDLLVCFLEAIKQNDNTTHSGGIKLERGWPITVPKIDVGKDNPFVFYIYNTSPYFAFVSPPEYVVLRRIGETERRTVPLGQPDSSRMSFTAFDAELPNPPESGS